MFFFQGAVKDNNTGKPVKFGYVVFAERGVAQKVLKSGSIAFNGGIQIKVSPMLWFFHLTLCNFQVEPNFFTGMREAPLGILWPHSAITNWTPQYQNYFNQHFPAFNSKSYFVSSFDFAIWLKIVPLTDLLLELRDDIWLYCSFGVHACLVKINEKTSLKKMSSFLSSSIYFIWAFSKNWFPFIPPFSAVVFFIPWKQNYSFKFKFVQWNGVNFIFWFDSPQEH